VIHGFARGRAADWLPAAHGKINKKFGLHGNSKGKYRIAVLLVLRKEIPVGVRFASPADGSYRPKFVRCFLSSG
jgi:hypothetical protein